MLIFGFYLKAQVSNYINYQGVALNNSGVPFASTTIKLKTKIHTGTPTGTVQYYEERSVTTDATGLFSFQIGSPGMIIAAGTIASVNWEQGEKYLQIEMDPANGNSFTDMGTQQLVTVPYAKVAEKFSLPYSTTDPFNTETFKITNTHTTGKAIVATVNNTNAVAITASNTSNGSAIKATTNGTAYNSSAIEASNTGTLGTAIKANITGTDAFSSAIEATNSGTDGAAISATANGSSLYALKGYSSNGIAMYGASNTNFGISGTSSSSTGVNGVSSSSIGVKGTSTSSIGVNGVSSTHIGVKGQSTLIGVYGESNAGIGISAYSNTGTALDVSTSAGTALETSGPSILNGNLQITGGNTNPSIGAVLTSDANGNATWKSNRIAFLGINMTASTIPHSSAVVVALTEAYDYGNCFNPTGSAVNPNTFIAPIAGIYHFDGAYQLSITSNVYNFEQSYGAFELNGTSNIHNANSYGVFNSATNSYICGQLSTDCHLNAGDKVRFKVYQYSQGSSTANVNADTRFSGHLVFAD